MINFIKIEGYEEEYLTGVDADSLVDYILAGLDYSLNLGVGNDGCRHIGTKSHALLNDAVKAKLVNPDSIFYLDKEESEFLRKNRIPYVIKNSQVQLISVSMIVYVTTTLIKSNSPKEYNPNLSCNIAYKLKDIKCVLGRTVELPPDDLKIKKSTEKQKMENLERLKVKANKNAKRPMKKEYVHSSFVLTPENHCRLKIAASRAHTSMSNLLNQILESNEIIKAVE